MLGGEVSTCIQNECSRDENVSFDACEHTRKDTRLGMRISEVMQEELKLKER